jgi:hypothetical protein
VSFNELSKKRIIVDSFLGAMHPETWYARGVLAGETRSFLFYSNTKKIGVATGRKSRCFNLIWPDWSGGLARSRNAVMLTGVPVSRLWLVEMMTKNMPFTCVIIKRL